MEMDIGFGGSEKTRKLTPPPPDVLDKSDKNRYGGRIQCICFSGALPHTEIQEIQFHSLNCTRKCLLIFTNIFANLHKQKNHFYCLNTWGNAVGTGVVPPPPPLRRPAPLTILGDIGHCFLIFSTVLGPLWAILRHFGPPLAHFGAFWAA